MFLLEIYDTIGHWRANYFPKEPKIVEISTFSKQGMLKLYEAKIVEISTFSIRKKGRFLNHEIELF